MVSGRVADDEEGEADEKAGDEQVRVEGFANDEGSEGEKGTLLGRGRWHVCRCWE